LQLKLVFVIERMRRLSAALPDVIDFHYVALIRSRADVICYQICGFILI
jgi:hypothetical protein